MKTNLKILAVVVLLSGFSLNTYSNTNAEIQKVAEVIAQKKINSSFKRVKLFEFEKNAGGNDNATVFVRNASLIKLRINPVQNLINQNQENIIFEIPVSRNNNMELELTRSYPVSPDFTLLSINENGKKEESYSNGIHYSGIIKGKENSIASVSIYKNFVMGIISDETGNYVLGKVKNSDNTFSDNYIFYNDADLNVENKFTCRLEDNEDRYTLPFTDISDISHNNSTDDPMRLPVKVYFQADYQMYLDGNSKVNEVGDFIVAFFNSVKTIYQNEGIPVEISAIEVWTVEDPYRNLTSPPDILTSFGANTQDNFEGNLAHLLSTRTDDLGGIAWIGVFCAQYNPQNSAGRFAFSNIEPGANNYPTYSWTVNVAAHEMGHNFGSKHTQACVWPIGNGIIGAIDSCYFPEGTCFLQSQVRPTVGTIMSYCHLWTPAQGGGINLALGFGPLPGDTIRLRYAQAHCLDQLLNSSERPATFDLSQNFPNPFNPNTVIRFALPAGSEVNLEIYDVSGRLISNLIKNKFYDAGFYDVEFDASDFNLSSGVYFYKLNTKDFSEVKRMVLIK